MSARWGWDSARARARAYRTDRPSKPVGVPRTGPAYACRHGFHECPDCQGPSHDYHRGKATVFTGWRTVTPGVCDYCDDADDWHVDGRGTIYCGCQRCSECDEWEGHAPGCEYEDE